MELPIEKLQISDNLKKAVSELNSLVSEAESIGLTVDFTAKNPRFDDNKIPPLIVSVCQIVKY